MTSMKSIFGLMTLVLLCATVQIHAASDCLIKMEGDAQINVPGTSLSKGFETYTEIKGVSFDVEAETSWTKGGGAAVGKPNPGKVSILTNAGPISIKTFLAIAMGKGYTTVTIVFRNSDAKGNLVPYFTVEMANVFITKVDLAGESEEPVGAKIEMVYKTIKMTYQEGKTKAEVFWDVPAGAAK